MMKRYEGLKNTLELIKQNWLKEKLVLANWYLLMSGENYWIYSNQSTCDDNVLDSEITRCLQAHGHLHSEIDACVFFHTSGVGQQHHISLTTYLIATDLTPSIFKISGHRSLMELPGRNVRTKSNSHTFSPEELFFRERKAKRIDLV